VKEKHFCTLITEALKTEGALVLQVLVCVGYTELLHERVVNRSLL